MAVINLRDAPYARNEQSKPNKAMVVMFEYIVPYGIAWGGMAAILYWVYRGLTCHC